MEQPVFLQLLMLMVVVWAAAVILRRLGWPTVMGELVMGVVLGPAVLGWVEPSEVIEVLAEMGIFFLMLHTGVETAPKEFFLALRSSLGVAIVGAVAPFTISLGIALAFDLPLVAAIFIGLTMTATAVVVTLKILYDLNLMNTRMARVIVASCVLDDLLTLIVFSVVLGLVRGGNIDGGSVDIVSLLLIPGKVILFFGLTIAIGIWFYPLFRHPFRNRDGKGFAFLLCLGLTFGLLAELIGLHIILGAYLAGLFFREEVASEELIQKVNDRLEGIAYTLLGPIFFISLGFHVTFDALRGEWLWFVLALTCGVFVIQIVSAGVMARRLNFSWVESATVGIGMCGRAEMAFVLASLALSIGVIDKNAFSALIFTTFLLNIMTPIGLTWCGRRLERGPPPVKCIDEIEVEVEMDGEDSPADDAASV